MKRFKWLVWLVLGCLLGVGLILASQRWSRQNVAELTRWRQSKLSPVIMIPGSSATENRFDRLVRKLNTDNRNPHSLLKVRVTNDDRLHFSGQLRQGDNEPIIVVGFENNRDGYQNIQQQARRFNLAFKALSTQYNFNNFKAIGHSNGGLIYTQFLEKYYSAYAQRIRVKRLMTIGSPYNFNEKTIRHKTQMLSDFIANRNRVPKSLTIYSVAGTQTWTQYCRWAEQRGTIPSLSLLATPLLMEPRMPLAF